MLPTAGPRERGGTRLDRGRRGAAPLGPAPAAECLSKLHTALAGTRGAAVAVAQLDTWAGRLRFAGSAM
ncbi:hypothetical protein GCM10023238_37290 [Streptomyces heliomycini]